MSQPQVTVGRQVHYYDANLRVRTAVVTAVVPTAGLLDGEQPNVVLTVFPPGAAPICSPDEVAYSEKPQPTHWTWPPRA